MSTMLMLLVVLITQMAMLISTYNAYAFGGADRTNGNTDIYNATQGQATGCYVDQNKITYGEDVSVTIQFSLCPNDWMVCSDKIACPLKEEENFCGKSAK